MLIKSISNAHNFENLTNTAPIIQDFDLAYYKSIGPTVMILVYSFISSEDSQVSLKIKIFAQFLYQDFGFFLFLDQLFGSPKGGSYQVTSVSFSFFSVDVCLSVYLLCSVGENGGKDISDSLREVRGPQKEKYRRDFLGEFPLLQIWSYQGDREGQGFEKLKFIKIENFILYFWFKSTFHKLTLCSNQRCRNKLQYIINIDLINVHP